MNLEEKQAVLGVGAAGAVAGTVILVVMLILGIFAGAGLTILGQPGTPDDCPGAGGADCDRAATVPGRT